MGLNRRFSCCVFFFVGKGDKTSCSLIEKEEMDDFKGSVQQVVWFIVWQSCPHFVLHVHVFFVVITLHKKNHVPSPRAIYIRICWRFPHGKSPMRWSFRFAAMSINKQHSTTSHTMSHEKSHDISWIIPYLVVFTTQLVSDFFYPTYKIL